VRTLVELVRGTHAVAVGPRGTTTPPLWLCGTSRSSAELAGSLGMHYAFHRYIAGSSTAARDAIAAYRDAFRATDSAAPYATIACYGACAESDDRAARQWRAADAGTACFTGSPSSCVDQLHGLAEACDADEIAVNLLGDGIDSRLAGYAMLGDAADLGRIAPAYAASA
jgi:alkanesulfonate monooxygenase SsuD/methylene tetrahydromethanopterin reductase-like flavin-dependent oxidoreductase (luciferase family)